MRQTHNLERPLRKSKFMPVKKKNFTLILVERIASAAHIG